MSVAIPLTRGQVAFVDEEDEPVVSAYAWYAVPRRSRGEDRAGWYASGYHKVRGYVLMHRLILGLRRGEPSVDHINGDGLDNRRSNLRRATSVQQTANSRPPDGRRYRGVHRLPSGRFVGRIVVAGSERHLGTFDSEDAAAQAWNEAALAAWGEYARLNETT